MGTNQDPIETLQDISAGKNPKDRPEKVKLKEHTDDELRKLASDIYNGHVFTDRHVRHVSELRMVFMILIFMERNQVESTLEDVGLIYEYMSEAGPRSINGLPCFMSMRMLSKDDTDRLNVYHEQYKAMQEQFLGKGVEKETSDEETF